MRMTTAADVMTHDVITTGPEIPFKDLIELMARHRISAVPVVEADGTLLGVVSEADLLCRQEHADDEPRSRPPLLAGRRTRKRWRKAQALIARDLMTSPVRTVSVEAFLPSVARMLSQAGVRRVFVEDCGRLVGVVARRDLLHAFLREDGAIRAEIEQDVFPRVLGADVNAVRAKVEHGVVTLTGRLEYQADVQLAVRRCEGIPGVVEVNNRLDYRTNGDTDSRRDEMTTDRVPIAATRQSGMCFRGLFVR